MSSHTKITIKTTLLSLLMGGLCATCLHASNNALGPDWDEENDGGRDAGSTKQDAMEVKLSTTSQLTSISGKLKGDGSGSLASFADPDFEDVYAVVITDPNTFEINTLAPTGFAEFNSSLYVFDSDANPLLGNRAFAPGSKGALVGDVSSDGTFKIDNPGVIYIAICGRETFPLNADGDIMFAFTADPTTVVGPASLAPKPLTSWSVGNPMDTGSYTIVLKSVGPIPTSCGAANAGSCSAVNALPYCNDAACCFTVCEADPFCCEVTWDSSCVTRANTTCTITCENCDGDLDGDNRINGLDLAILLGRWQLSDECADINGDGIVNGADLSILLQKWGTECI
ncbi:MAG: hypothetical protein CMJ53_06595 [Planctomycetaceae bacterium]|nr:hypothetical protein [Planctomycetaceae bacterium]